MLGVYKQYHLMWVLMGEGGGMKYCTWDREGNWCQCEQKREENVFVRCPVQPAELARGRGSDLADGCCETALSYTPQTMKCVYFSSLFNIVLNSGFQFGLVLPNIQKSLIVLENALRFHYKYTIFFAKHNEYSSPPFHRRRRQHTLRFVSRA